MKIRSLLSVSLSLILVGGCSSQTGTFAPARPGTQSASTSQNTTQGTAQSTAAAELQADLAELHADEVSYADTVSLASAETGFSTQMLPGEALRPADLTKEQALQVRARLQELRQQFQTQLDKIRDRLTLRREVAAEQLRWLHRRSHQDCTVRISDKVRVENPDGSVTETIKVNFANSCHDVIREAVLARTSKDGKLLKLEFQLHVTTPAFERDLTRIATYAADGSKHVLIDAKTSWRDGKIRERHEERLVNADGSATGKGTITVTLADGTVKTYQYTVSIAANGEITSSARDAGHRLEVKLAEKANGRATVSVTEDGREHAAEVDLEAESSD
ncbi:MAG TPA: hypothetical protein V6D23_13310 [Candidatus Obscuribacterales bacterium]